MLNIVYTTQFKRDYKLALKRKANVEKLFDVIDLLQRQIPLPLENKDHSLMGKYIGYRECHIEPDFLLVYKVNDIELELILYRAGTHSDIF